MHAIYSTLFLSLAAYCLLAVSSASAATKTWDGSETNASWATAANWTTSGVPASGDDAVFTSSSTIGYSIYLGNANRTINSITFDSTTTSTPYNINLYDADLTTARTLTLGAGGVTVAAGNHTITSAYVSNTVGYLKLSNNTAFDIASGASLDLNSRMTFTSINNNNTKTGLGTLILSKNNGGTNGWQNSGASTGFTVSEGILRLSAANALGNSQNKFVISSGAAMELTGGFSHLSTNGTITINGTGIGGAGAIRSLSGNNTLGTATGSGTIILNTASSIGVDAGTLTIGKGISGSNSLTKVGAGTLVLGRAAGINNNTYSGATRVDAGTLRFAIQGALYTNNTANWTAANLNVKNGATLAFNVGGSNEFTTGNVTTLLTNLADSSSATNGMNAGSKLGFDTTNAAGGTFTIADVIADTTGTSGGARGLTKLGTGSLVLSNTNTYTGATTVSAGTLYITGGLSNSNVIVEADGSIGSNGANGSIVGDLSIQAGGTIDLTGATMSAISSGILSLSGGTLTLGELTFQDLVGWDWLNADAGIYELIDGTFSIDWGSTAYLDADSAYDFGNGNKGYFTSGSLNAVIVAVPEPATALLGSLGLLLLLHRRRCPQA